VCDQVLAGAGQRPQRPRLVAVRGQRPEAVAVGARELGQHVGVEAIGLSGAGKALARGFDLVGVHGQDAHPRLEQAVDQDPLRPLDRNHLHLGGDKQRDQAAEARLVVCHPLLQDPLPVGAADPQVVVLACPVQPGGWRGPLPAVAKLRPDPTSGLGWTGSPDPPERLADELAKRRRRLDEPGSCGPGVRAPLPVTIRRAAGRREPHALLGRLAAAGAVN
jgi:hypothetical protein